MTQPGARSEWIQHDPEHVQRVAEYLPHLWREIAPPSLGAPAPPAPADDAPAPDALEAATALTQARLAEAEARFAAELAAVRAESEQWRAHALAVEAEARAQGFAAGYAEGERQGRSDGATAIRAEEQASLACLAALADAGVVEMQAALMAAHETLAALGIAIARAIVGEAFALDPSLLARRITRLLERLSDVTTATVRLHPTDLAVVQPHWPDLAQTYGWGEQGPRLLGDDAVTPGGCVVEARTHYLDAQIETLCDMVRETFAALPPPRAPGMTKLGDAPLAAVRAMVAEEAA
jgi:flagellar assembly protein FliH